MKITRIKIQNFGLIESADIPIRGHSLAIFGMNGQAKTTVINALHWTLFGWCEHTDRRGAGARDLIRDGAAEAVVEVHFEHGAFTGFANATIGRKENVFDLIDSDGVIVQTVRSRDGMWNHLGLDPRIALLAAMPLEMFRDKANSQVLADYLSRSITPETVLHHCHENADAVQAFAKQHHLPLRNVEDFRAIGDVAYTARRSINRDLKQAHAEYELLAVTVAPTKPDGSAYSLEDAADVSASLAKVRGLRDDLIAQRTRADAAAGADIEAERAKIEAAKTEAETLRSKIGSVNADITGLEERLAALQAESDAAAKGSAATVAERDRLVRLRRDIAALEAGCECPTCLRKLTDKQQEAVLSTIGVQIEAASKAHDDALAASTAARQALEPQRKLISAGKEELQGLASTMARAEAVAGMIPPEPYTGPSAEEVALSIAKLDEQIAKGERVAKQLDEMKQSTLADKRVAFLTGESEKLGWIVDAFKKGEVIGKLIKDELAAFASVCNEELLPLGFHIEFEADGKNITPILQCPGKPPRRAALCSRSERALAALAIACGFGRTGVPVMLDDLDGFDGVRRTELLKQLAGYNAGSMIVAGAWQHPGTKVDAVARALPSLAVVWCDMGVVQTINAAEAA
jgi:hypothetical protein